MQTIRLARNDMRTNWQIGRIGGIPLQFHWSFIFVFVWVVYTSWAPEGGIDTDALFSVGIWVTMVFIAVLLHEYGHAIMARLLGVGTKKIVVYPLGGGAYLEKMPEEPHKEILIAVAGPLVNILLALSVAPLIWLTENWKRKALLVYILRPESNVPVFGIGPADYAIALFFILNLLLAFFNLLPAYPLDGGRIFRAALTWILGRRRATLVASLMGVAFALVFLGFAIATSDWLFGVGALLVGAFAVVEMFSTQRTRFLSRHFVPEVMSTAFPRVYLQEDMPTAFQRYQQSGQPLLVFNEWQDVVGTLGEEQFKHWQSDSATANALVQEHYHPQWMACTPSDNLLVVARQLDEHGLEVMPVFDKGKVSAVLSGQQIRAFLKKHAWWRSFKS